MKHFDKLTCVTIQLDFLEEWGDPNRIVDEEEGDTLDRAIWREVAHAIDTEAPENKRLCAITDVTNGFDVGSVRCEIFNFESEAELTRTIDWCQSRLEQAAKKVLESIAS